MGNWLDKYQDYETGNNTNYANGGKVTPKEFTQQYVQSPKFKERLISSNYENVDDEILDRLQNIQSTHTYSQRGKPSIAEQLKFEVNNTPYTTGGSAYLPKQKAIIVDLEQANEKGIDPRYINAHEFGHSELSPIDIKELKYNSETGIRNTRLNDRDIQSIIGRLGDNANSVYKKAPDEIKADLNGLRYELFDKGIYNAGEEDFNYEDLQKLEDSYIKKRLLKNYSEDDLIWLMNNIAMNKKLQNTNDFGNFTENNNWLEKYT